MHYLRQERRKAGYSPTLDGARHREEDPDGIGEYILDRYPYVSGRTTKVLSFRLGGARTRMGLWLPVGFVLFRTLVIER